MNPAAREVSLTGVRTPLLCERFAGLSDEAFEAARQEAIGALGPEQVKPRRSPSQGDVVYQEQVFPCELERVRRAAASRLQTGDDAVLDLLFVTVGAQPESPTLAIVATPARYVILLHTDEEWESANDVVGVLGLNATESRLLSLGDGKNPVRLYEIVFREWKERGRPDHVGVDLTGGLKTMSAAAAVAAFALPRARLFYIDARQPRMMGGPRWIDEERLEMENPFRVFGEIDRSAARELLRHGRYSAAAAAYHRIAARVRDKTPDLLRAKLAEGFDAIERLDFATGAALLEALDRDLAGLKATLPDDSVIGMRSAIGKNARGARSLALAASRVRAQENPDPAKDRDVLISAEGLELVAMVVESARRRFVDGSYDIAALLAYRAIELIGQRRLAMLGETDPSAMDWHGIAEKAGMDLADLVDRYNAKLKDARYRLPASAGDLPTEIGMAVCYTLLAVAFPADLTEGMDLKKLVGVGQARNRSLLAHGIQLLGQEAAKGILDMADKLLARLLTMEGLDEPSARALFERHRLALVTD
ncbi:MAG: TIGR02710 family CRISPR-associated protein [Candidatus Sericytochromatia bacterium]|nr:TIGR02710 family CRISPR-associated protein [Candidatus Tanganyikabacteria bacterium]